MVTLENVTKRYPGSARQPEFVAVRGVNLEVAAGEFMVLVGPSGCGKSTTLRMIAGLEDISAGTIRIDGRVVNEVAPKDRDIAMVFQNYALYPHLSVYDNMAFGLKLRGFDRPEIDRRVTEAAALLGLGELLPRKPKTLSGGQRQRVAVGRAIVRRPKVFLFDEPLSNLDAKMRVSMRAEIARLHQRLGATMIYVTHDQVEAMTMGTRICVMNGGGIVQVDRPLALYQQPANLFAAGFIGSPPMNFLRGHVETVDGRAMFAETNATGAALRLALPERLARVGSARAGRPVVLGVRPEDITPGPGPAVRVDVVEPMGSETLLHANTGASTFIARVPPTEAYRAGTAVELTFNLDRAHLFDPETTLVLR